MASTRLDEEPRTGPQPATALPPEASPAERLTGLLALASQHEQAGRLDEAEALLGLIRREAPDHAGALHQLGIIAFRKGRAAEAAQLMERSIELVPGSALFHRNLCEIYRMLGRRDDALAIGRRAVALDPADPHCHHNLSVLHYDRVELDDAIACAERALAINPDFPAAHFGIAEASLLRGDFARGWEEYQWRFRLAGVPALLPPTDRPRWDGSPLGRGNTLLLIADQGYGDAIQFSRYMSWAAERCPEIAIACSAEMRPVLAQQPGGALLFDHWNDCPAFAAYCALSGLPRVARSTAATIPNKVPYLRADPARCAQWAERLATLLPQGYRRIGIVWAGRPTHHNDRRRSIALARLAPLAALPGVALVSLQKGDAQTQIGSYWGRAPLVNLGPEIRDYADTMAIIECLDLVVTVDTSVAHLAGAMAKPVWIMLPYAPDWRWGLDSEQTPWYPTARLFRQDRRREWWIVVERIAAALAKI